MGRDTEKRPRHLPGRHSGLVVGARSGARRQVEVARVGPCWRRRAWRVVAVMSRAGCGTDGAAVNGRPHVGFRLVRTWIVFSGDGIRIGRRGGHRHARERIVVPAEVVPTRSARAGSVSGEDGPAAAAVHHAAPGPIPLADDERRRPPPAQGGHPAAGGRARGPLVGDPRHDPRDRGPRVRFRVGRRAPPLPLAGSPGARSVGGLDAPRGDRRDDDADRARATRRLYELPQPSPARQAGRHDRRDQRRAVRPRPGRRLERDGVPRVRLPIRPSDRPVRGGVHDHPDAPP